MVAKAVIDKITYTASLVSHPEEVDTVLDPLRLVSARVDPNKELKGHDLTTLTKVQGNLEDYLVHHETMRAFTTESLHKQIDRHVRGEQQHGERSRLRIAIIAAIILGIIGGFLPRNSLFAFHIEFGGVVAASMIHVGAAWLFYDALQAFKAPLRQGFGLVSFGVALLGISLLQQPLIEYFHLRGNPAMDFVFHLPTLIAASFFYHGNRVFSKMVGVRSKWLSWKLIIVLWVATAAFVMLMPVSKSVTETKIFFELGGILGCCIIWMPTASAFILHKAIHLVPTLYKPATKALYQAMFPIIILTTFTGASWIINGPKLVNLSAYIAFTLLFVEGAMLLRAGYAFSRAREY